MPYLQQPDARPAGHGDRLAELVAELARLAAEMSEPEVEVWLNRLAAGDDVEVT